MSRFAGKRPERPSLTPRPPGDLWVFGYGSLMWRPNFPHTDVQPALVHGYHRALCIYSVAYRGTYECQWLVLVFLWVVEWYVLEFIVSLYYVV